MAGSELKDGGFDRRRARRAEWQRVAERSPAELVAYARIQSLHAAADRERLARQVRSSGERPSLRLRLGLVLVRLATALATESVATSPRPGAPQAATPCPE